MATKLTVVFEAISNKMTSAMNSLAASIKTQSNNPAHENPEEGARNTNSRDSELYVKTGEILNSFRQQSEDRQNTQRQSTSQTVVGRIKHQRIGQIVHQKIEKGAEGQTSIRIREKKPVKMSDIQVKRKKLLDQLNKIDEQLEDINKETLQEMQNSASIRALDFVKKMNEERKRKEEKLIMENQKLKKAKEQRELFEKRKQEELQKAIEKERLEKEEKDKKWKVELERRKQLRQKDEIKKVALMIVSELVESVLVKDEAYVPQTLKLIRYGEESKGSQRKLMSLSVSRTVKRTPADIVLKLDKEKHHYPMNMFRQKILEEERRRKELERQIEQERSRLNQLKRKYNKPLNKSMVGTETQVVQEKRQNSETMLNRNALMILETALRESNVKSIKKTENNESQRGSVFDMASQSHIEIEKPITASELENKQEVKKEQAIDYTLFNLGPEPKIKTQTSEDMEMQFFKASEPDPEVLQRVKEQIYEKQLFFEQFQLELGDENADMREMVVQYRKSKGLPTQSLTEDDYVFNF